MRPFGTPFMHNYATCMPVSKLHSTIDCFNSTFAATPPVFITSSLWSTDTWLEVGQLPGHKLTVIQMEFSHDDQ